MWWTIWSPHWWSLSSCLNTSSSIWFRIIAERSLRRMAASAWGGDPKSLLCVLIHSPGSLLLYSMISSVCVPVCAPPGSHILESENQILRLALQIVISVAIRQQNPLRSYKSCWGLIQEAQEWCRWKMRKLGNLEGGHCLWDGTEISADNVFEEL